MVSVVLSVEIFIWVNIMVLNVLVNWFSWFISVVVSGLWCLGLSVFDYVIIVFRISLISINVLVCNLLILRVDIWWLCFLIICISCICSLVIDCGM